ncbi:flagellin [Diaminobutyricimonas sp. TR449]|uniref:flagellin N-terminal helical domain-containing protein n=1 Tax=Diaminobutyricimonas sp. TR449 TaxID=2708076 RepID=UPI001AB05AA1|nr:flagellin [Diaminobutyricimonas sp. TR449]
MGMQINTNIAALNAHRNLSNTQNDLSKSLEKLSSGLRINRAADDAAGLAISEGLRAQVNGLTVAARNAQDGISVIQTAEGALTEVHSILQRMRDLAVQGGNDSNNAESRLAIKAEADALGKELDRVTQGTNFNGIALLNGTAGAATDGVLSFQVGAGSTGNDKISVTLANVATDVGTLGSAAGATGFDVTNATAASTTITAIDAAITKISTSRAGLGAVQNRFESTINSLNVSKENLTAAESRIRDTDMASEMVNFTRANILSQAGTAMLAQANQSNQGVLQLLG